MKIRQNVRHWAAKQAMTMPVVGERVSDKLATMHTGIFLDRTDVSGAATSVDGLLEAGMGVAVGDVDGDALPDLLVTNFASEPNSLYVNRGGGRFRERSRPTGIAAASVSKLAFGATFQDLDADGREDLFAACGHVLRHADEEVEAWGWEQSDQALRATAGGRFEPLDLGPLLGTPRVGRGLAAGDLDGDLAPDLAVSNSAGPLVVGLNRLPRAGEHLRVRPLGHGPNTGAIGARVTLQLDDGSEQHRWVRAGTGYLSQDDRRPTFGVPAGRRPVEVRVRWPDGTRSTHPAGRAGEELAVAQPERAPR